MAGVHGVVWLWGCIFAVFFLTNLLHTRNIIIMTLPRWFRCQDLIFMHAGVGWSQRVKLVNAYLRMKYDFSKGPLAFNVSRWAAVTSFCLLNFHMYTPGQKFIDFFFNELSHRDNGEYQQFVNSGMVTYRFSKKLRNIECVGALATVQCP